MSWVESKLSETNLNRTKNESYPCLVDTHYPARKDSSLPKCSLTSIPSGGLNLCVKRDKCHDNAHLDNAHDEARIPRKASAVPRLARRRKLGSAHLDAPSPYFLEVESRVRSKSVAVFNPRILKFSWSFNIAFWVEHTTPPICKLEKTSPWRPAQAAFQ